MMGKISKRFSLTIGILGGLCFVWGVSILVISWVLQSKAPTSITYREHFAKSSRKTYIHPYWWGGIGFLIPGILGIAAGYTKNVIAMAFFLIFNTACLITSVVMSVMVGMVIVDWGELNKHLSSEFLAGCKTNPDPFQIEKQCICFDLTERKTWTMDGATCADLLSVQEMFVALITVGTLAALMSSITTFISCCSLWKQEKDYTGLVVPQQVDYVEPSPMVASNTSSYEQAAPTQYQSTSRYQAPPPYNEVPQGSYATTNDKVQLI